MGVIDKYNAFQVEGSEALICACERDRGQEGGRGEGTPTSCLGVLPGSFLTCFCDGGSMTPRGTT